MNHLKKLFACLFLLCALSFSVAAEDKPLMLSGADGHEHTPLAAGNKRAIVLFFVSAYCPTSNTFMAEMNKITADYGAAFAFYFVHSDRDQRLTDVLQHTEMNTIKAAVLLDKDQRLAKLAHAKITPEAVVISPDGKALYQGRINDLYLGPTKRQRQATTKDLRDALDAIQGGKAVTSPKTEAIGCKIGGLE